MVVSGIFDNIHFLADLQVLVAAPMVPIAHADSIPITTPASEPSGPVLSQVPLSSETTHVGQVQVTPNAIVGCSELSGSELLFFNSKPTRISKMTSTRIARITRITSTRHPRFGFRFTRVSSHFISQV